MLINQKERRLKFIAITEGIILAIILVTYLTSKLPEIINYIYSLNPKIEELRFDLTRTEDAANILLAIQDFIIETEEIPQSLEYLVNRGYLNAKITDPKSGHTYYFEKKDGSFILCIYMSDRIKGVNTKECPSKYQFMTAQIIDYQIKRWLFTILWTFSLTTFTVTLYFLGKRFL